MHAVTCRAVGKKLQNEAKKQNHPVITPQPFLLE